MPDDSTHMHRVLVQFAAGALLVELLLAESALRILWKRSLSDLLLDGNGLILSLTTGVVAAIVVAGVSRSFFATFARDLTREFFAPVFRGLAIRNVVALAVLPGLGEELLFRGVLQIAIGLLPAAIIFGILHSGFSRRLLPYGIWATVVGALLGSIYLWTGNLWGSIVAHAIINASGALWLRRPGVTDNETGTGNEIGTEGD
jgi:uncharacterized protein